MNLDDDADLYQLYGTMANLRVVPIRNICRQRIEGYVVWSTQQTLRDHAGDAETLGALIETNGGSIGAVRECENIESVLRYWSDHPERLHQIVTDAYHDMYHDPTDGETTCPYEENSSKKACWSCHLPREVWSIMEEEYHDDGD